jgi:hypothetical protein
MNQTVEKITSSVNDILTPQDDRPSFRYNGLATPPARAVRSFFGLFGRLDVPPGVWGVCFVPKRPPIILEPGTHWLSGGDAMNALIQFVDATQKRRMIDAVSGVSLDGWEINLKCALIFHVHDPARIVQSAEPLAALDAVARSAILAQIESMPHEALLGDIDTPTKLHSVSSLGEAISHNGHHPSAGIGLEQAGRGIDLAAQGILQRLSNRPSLAGLRIVDVAIVERSGDQRLVEILHDEALARIQTNLSKETETARAELEKLRLGIAVQAAEAERAVSIIQAETQTQLASLQERLRILEARTEAEVQEIHQTQEAREADRKRVAEEWRTAKELEMRSMEYQHEETLAVIQGTAQITTEAAKNGLFEPIGSLKGNSRSFEIEPAPQPDAVSVGIQALRNFRDKISPPTTHFLPQSSANQPMQNDRLEAESIRLDLIECAEHQLLVRHGQLSGAEIWFTDRPGSLLDGLKIEITCPTNYPFESPAIRILSPQEETWQEYPISNWDAQLFLADAVRQAIYSLVLKTTVGG